MFSCANKKKSWYCNKSIFFLQRENSFWAQEFFPPVKNILLQERKSCGKKTINLVPYQKKILALETIFVGAWIAISYQFKVPITQ